MAKTINKLTDKAIQAAITQATAGEQTQSVRKLPDGAGLYLWVHQDGRAYWRLRFFVDGKEKSLSLGVYPEVTLEKARAACNGYSTGRGQDKEHIEGVRDKLRRGVDPSAERKAKRKAAATAAANSFKAVADEWYAKQATVWSPGHAADMRKWLDDELFPDLGDRPIDQIDAPEILDCLRKIEQRGAVVTAHRVRAVAGAVFRYGIATGRCRHNPAADLSGALTAYKTAGMKAVDVKHLPQLLADIDTYDQKHGSTQVRLAMQLLLVTAVRTTELINAVWSEIDFDAAMWTIPASRMKKDRDHLVPLSRQALEILDELKMLAGRSDYVLPGHKYGKPISNVTILAGLYAMGYRGKQTGHGFRSLFSTTLNEESPWRDRPDVIEFQLAHVQKNKTRAAYNRALYLDDRKLLLQWWADRLDALRTGKVVAIGRAAA